MTQAAALYGKVKPPALAADFDVLTLRLDSGPLHADLAAALDDVEMVRTITGASTLTPTFSDDDSAILRSGLLELATATQVGSHLAINGLGFTMVSFQRQNSPARQIVGVFEDEIVAALRTHTGYRRAYRDQMTRAQFIESLAQEARVPFYCPQLHDRQAASPTKYTAAQRRDLKKPGFHNATGLSVHGSPATPAELRIAQTILDVGVKLAMPYKVLVSAITTAITESSLSNLNHGDAAGPDSVGVFQQRDSWGPRSVRTDPAGAAGLFFQAAAKRNQQFPNASIAELGAVIQFPGVTSTSQSPIPWVVSQQGPRVAEAQAILKAFGMDGTGYTPAALTLQNGPVVANQRYAFERKKGENSWTCMTRLASEVGWRLFPADGVLYYIDDLELLASQPQFAFDDDTEGIDYIDFQVDTGKTAATAKVYCEAARWTVAPGEVAVMKDTMGPAAGRWLVGTITRTSLFQASTEIDLVRPAPPKPEPSASAGTASTSVGGAALLTSDLNGLNLPTFIVRAYKKAVAIAGRHFPYQWGGGHNSAFLGPYDCSGGVSAVIHAGDPAFLSSPEATGALISLGQPGTGQYMTWWVHNGGPGNGHTFITFTLPGHGEVFWECGGAGGLPSGFHPARSKSGFSPRHYGGT